MLFCGRSLSWAFEVLSYGYMDNNFEWKGNGYLVLFKNYIWAGDSLQDRSKNRLGQSLIDAHTWKILIYLEWKIGRVQCNNRS